MSNKTREEEQIVQRFFDIKRQLKKVSEVMDEHVSSLASIVWAAEQIAKISTQLKEQQASIKTLQSRVNQLSRRLY